MRGKIRDVFDLKWGVTLALDDTIGSARVGDELTIGARHWIISGFPHIKRIDESADSSTAVTLADASFSELEALVGQSFETTGGADHE